MPQGRFAVGIIGGALPFAGYTEILLALEQIFREIFYRYDGDLFSFEEESFYSNIYIL